MIRAPMGGRINYDGLGERPECFTTAILRFLGLLDRLCAFRCSYSLGTSHAAKRNPDRDRSDRSRPTCFGVLATPLGKMDLPRL